MSFTSQMAPEVRRGEYLALAAVAAIFLGLGIVYSVVNPPFEAPDEQWHFLFARHLAAGRGLPVQHRDGALNVAGGESGQPPIYYLLGAALTSWIAPDELDHLIEPNPSGSRGYPASDGNKNVWVQLRPDGFPWQGEYLAAHLLRLLSLTLGTLAVIGTYLAARELFPNRRSVSLGAASIAALTPQFLFMSAAVNNDSTAAAAGAWTLYLVSRTTLRDARPLRDVLLGGVLGLAALSKLSMLAAIPFGIGLTALAALRRDQEIAAAVVRLVRVAVPMAIVAGWWYVRNWRLYGDPMGLSVFLPAVGSRGDSAVSLGEILADLPGLKASYWALFGWFSIAAEPWVYLFYDLLSLAALVGLALHVWRERSGALAMVRVGLPMAWTLIVLASLVRYRMMLLAFQGRLLFPAIASISILLALGLASLPPRLPQPLTLSAVLAGMLALATLAPLRYIAPAYAAPPPLTDVELESAQRRLGVVYGGTLELVGYSPARPRVDADGKLRVDLYWRAVTATPANYSISVQLLDSLGRRVAQDDSYPGRGALPTSRLRPGDAVRDRRVLALRADSTTATTGALVVAVYRPRGETVEARDPSGADLGRSPVIGRYKTGPVTTAELVADPRGALGGQVTLLEHSVDTRQARSGEELRGRLVWQALREMDEDYTVFVQLIGPAGLVAQCDSQPRAGSYPTSWWDRGEIVGDAFAIPLRQVRPGEYRLIAGLYDLRTGRRLAAGDADYLDLGAVAVVE